jgi:hypothetical protein
MAGKKAISVSQFAEHFRRAWLGTQEKFYSGRSLDRNDFNQLPRKLGKESRPWLEIASLEKASTNRQIQASPSVVVPTPWLLHIYVAN